MSLEEARIYSRIIEQQIALQEMEAALLQVENDDPDEVEVFALTQKIQLQRDVETYPALEEPKATLTIEGKIPPVKANPSGFNPGDFEPVGERGQVRVTRHEAARRCER